MKPDLCIYHGNCQDGFGAAWAIWKRFGDAVEYVPGFYDDRPRPDVTGKHVLMVDFTWKRPVLEGLAALAESIVILDHHKSAEEDLADFRIEMCGSAKFIAEDVESILADRAELGLPRIVAEFDMNRSGAGMAWDYCHPGAKRPRLIQHIEDRDLWRMALPWMREIAACVFSHPYSFSAYERLAAMVESDRQADDIIREGIAIERKAKKDIAELLGVSTRRMVIGGVDVPVANLPYTMASDAANKLAEGEPFAACYFDTATDRTFSLRSCKTGMDVQAIAVRYGGGGHPNAAGFRVPLGWEGDPSGPVGSA